VRATVYRLRVDGCPLLVPSLKFDRSFESPLCSASHFARQAEKPLNHVRDVDANKALTAL
jgi:hypothetical protein